MFEKEKFQVIKEAIPQSLAKFCFDYFLLKKNAVKHMYDELLIPQNEYFGKFGDDLVPSVYTHYADMVMETLLVKVLPIIKEKTNLDLIPTYSYARIYENGAILRRHKDRPSCEISTTLNLGGDNWPIYLDPTGNSGEEGIQIDLNPGDMLIYSGCDLEHWRHNFDGNLCAQVFLHYNNKNGRFGETNKLDGRPVLGIQKYL